MVVAQLKKSSGEQLSWGEDYASCREELSCRGQLKSIWLYVDGTLMNPPFGEWALRHRAVHTKDILGGVVYLCNIL